MPTGHTFPTTLYLKLTVPGVQGVAFHDKIAEVGVMVDHPRVVG